MAAQFPSTDEENPFGQPFSSSEHGRNYESGPSSLQNSTFGSHISAFFGRGNQSPTTSPSPTGSGTSGCNSSHQGPELLNKLEGGAEDVNGAVLIPGQNGKGVITISNDRSVRVWLMRDNGQYWPSVCHYMNAAATALSYHPGSRKIFIGVETGSVSEFILAEDFNRIDHKRDYQAHQSRVTGLQYCDTNKWLLSVGKDKNFQFHCTETGRRLGGYGCSSSCTTLEYDQPSKYIFIGDSSGQITVCKLDTGCVQYVNTLKGQGGSIQSLYWDSNQGWLFSGSYDSTVFVWDIGGRQGTVYELHGHKHKVTGIRYSFNKRNLLSVSEDQHLVVWDMTIRRLENPDWAESDTCQLCSRPFFWNLRAMYDQKQIGLRQHHCRRCGKAVCASCSTKTCPLPLKGHEFPVRVCEDCYIHVSDDEKHSHARFHDLRHAIRHVDMDEASELLLTVGQDRIVRLWSLKSIL